MTSNRYPYKVYTFSKNFSEIVQWLQDNVGQLLHSNPIIFWHGEGWHMRSYYVTSDDRSQNQSGWCIEIEDEKKATLCALKWSG